MSKRIKINITPDQNVIVNPITLNQGVVNHSVTHQLSGSDELLHNLLGGLQGGFADEYYHISSGQYFNLTTGDVVRPYETGIFYTRDNPSGYLSSTDLSIYVTGDIVRPSETGIFITESQTGQFYPISNPSGYISEVENVVFTTGDQIVNGRKTFTDHLTLQSFNNQLQIKTGSDGNTIFITAPAINANRTYTIPDVGSAAAFVLNAGPQTINGDKNFTTRPTVNTTGVLLISETGDFYANSNPSGFITQTDLSPYVLDSETGNFVTKSQTGSFYPRSNPSGYITGVSNVVFTIGNQTINGVKTFTSLPLVNGTAVILASDTGQFYPTSNPSGYISNITNVVYITGDQAINGAKTFNSHVTLQDSTNQLRFKTGLAGNTIFINVPNINGNHTYTIPDVGVSAAFVMTDGPQTINGSKTFNIRPTVSGTDVALASEIINLVFTTGNQKISGIKIFGENNEIVNSTYSHVLGGRTNAISDSNYAVIGGGLRNSTSGNYSIIVGGQDNSGNSNHLFIGGGRFNLGLSSYSFIGGGQLNKIYGTNGNSFIGGGNSNQIGVNINSNTNSTVIAGGYFNSAEPSFSFIGGGYFNLIQGNLTSQQRSSIVGGTNNIISYASNSVICGGEYNRVSSNYSSIVGGRYNTGGAFYSCIFGGENNRVGLQKSCILNGEFNKIDSSVGTRNNILNGWQNTIYQASDSFIGFGESNLISGYDVDAGEFILNVAIENCSILNGSGNKIFNHKSAILNGDDNIISGEGNTIVCGNRSYILSNHTGAVILADRQNRDHLSKGSDTCSLDFASGVYLRLPSFTGSKDQAGNFGELKVSGEYLYIATGQDTWGRIQISTF